jgi:putative transposase
MRSRRSRLRTFDYLGKYRYFLTFCTRERTKLFVRPSIVDPVLQQILHAASEHVFSIPAYVFMPDHVHLLVEGLAESSDLRAFVKLAKQKSGYLSSQESGHLLWQPSYYDRVLRDDESSLSVMRYILSNPVRANLVARWEDYPFLGSTTHSIDDLRDAFADRGDAWHP